MLLSQLIERMQNLIAEHGDHKVQSVEYEGDYVPYRAEWLRFESEGPPDFTEGAYVI